jgi:hypothetical protein
MPEQISFKGTVFWDDSAGGAGWKFTPGILVNAAVEAKAPLGTGYWVKPAGVDAVTHTLEVSYRSTAKATLMASLRALATATTGSLVVPGGWGTFTKCRLSAISPLDDFASDGGAYMVRTSLTFTQYP